MHTQKLRWTHVVMGMIMCLLMVVNLTPMSAYAEGDTTSGSQSTTVWEYSKSKAATNLDTDLTSDITLSLPSSDEQLSTEVCFVLDKSQFSDTKDSALQLLSDLKSAVESSGAKVKVDVIGFNRTATEIGSYDLSTEYDDIVDAFEAKMQGGTNMHAGLLLAQEVLAEDTSIPDDRKYMILVSDGDTYLYCKNGDYTTPYSRSYRSSSDAIKGYAGGYYDEGVYYPSAPMEGNVGRPSTSDASAWEAYLADVEARNTESNGDSYDFVWNYYDHLWKLKSAEEIVADGFLTQPRVSRSASNMDMAFFYAADVYHELASQYHCYALAVPSWNTADGGHSAFMEYLNNGAANGFESIENEVIYLLGAGSTVDDYMGYTEDYNFNLTDPASMTMTVETADGTSTQTYTAHLIDENHYGFGPLLDDGSYSYEVTYYPEDLGNSEHLTWKTNVNVTNFERVNLHYTVQLANPQDEAGTYGVYDADGSQGEDGLYTNSSAVLNPVTSDGTAEASEEFAKPTVSYTRYEVVYTDGVDSEEVFSDQSTVVTAGAATPAFEGTPTRDGYTFMGWSPVVADTVTDNVTYIAQWEAVDDGSDTGDTTDTDDGDTTDTTDTDDGDTTDTAGTTVDTTDTTDTTGTTADTDGVTADTDDTTDTADAGDATNTVKASASIPQTNDTVNLGVVVGIIVAASVVLIIAWILRNKRSNRRR